MTIRTNMQPLVDYVRLHGNAADDDIYSGVVYWTDEQLQDILDSISRWDTVYLKQVNLAVTKFKMSLPQHYWLESDTITVIEPDETIVSTAVTYSAPLQELTFVSALDSEKSYLVNGRFFNMWEALADFWFRKAEQRADFVNFKAGNNKMNMEEEYEHCMDNHKLYRMRTIRRFNR